MIGQHLHRHSQHALIDDIRSQEEIPHVYARLLQRSCNSFAVFYPRKAADGGGSIGDCGYIEKGAFRKLFNVYDESVPAGLPRLSINLKSDIYRDERVNHQPFLSSSVSKLSFEAPLEMKLSTPLDVAPTSVSPKVSLNESESTFAFLALVGRVYQVNALHCVRRKQLEDYATNYRHALRRMYHNRVVFVCETTQAAGYVGGVAYHHSKDLSTDIAVQMGTMLQAKPRLSMAHEDNMVRAMSGPSTWHKGSPVDQTVALSFVMARRGTTRIAVRVIDKLQEMFRPVHETPLSSEPKMFLLQAPTQEPDSLYRSADEINPSHHRDSSVTTEEDVLKAENFVEEYLNTSHGDLDLD